MECRGIHGRIQRGKYLETDDDRASRSGNLERCYLRRFRIDCEDVLRLRLTTANPRSLASFILALVAGLTTP
ncbi:hypothetical protein BDW67DRAFT_114372 [Aspergillus spinulosporus]